MIFLTNRDLEIMNEITPPMQSTRTLIYASITALVISIIVFVMIILPAEYNVDPTGTGKLLGLTVLANKGAPTTDVHLPAPAIATQKLLYEYQENETRVVVPANHGVEYKFKMQQYANLTYEWHTQGESLLFDFHGEPLGDTTGYFESYALATTHEMKGSMTVPFEGVHGWYWKNTSDKEVIVTLITQGNYEVVGLLH